jgi:Na+-transporting NADH:ubiquinone oxidoreductase subunit F
MKEKKDGWRLSCQVAVKNDMKINIPEEVFGVKVRIKLNKNGIVGL